jgi:hypothetical protein
MKQLSSAFVVVEETRDVTVCEYVTRHMDTVHRFAIVWDSDHDVRVVEAIHILMISGHMDHIDAIGEHSGMLTLWTTSDRRVPDTIHISNDQWTAFPTDESGFFDDVRRVFVCGLRPWSIGGGQ